MHILEFKLRNDADQVPRLLFGECHTEPKFPRRTDGLDYWFSRVELFMHIIKGHPGYCSNPAGPLPWKAGPRNLI